MASEKNRRVPLPVIVIVVVLAVGAGWWWWNSQAVASRPSTLSGTIESTEYRVASAIAGRIATVTAGEGNVVEKGDELVSLDSRALALQVTQAEQGVKAAQAQVRQAEDDGSDADVDFAKARLAQAKAAVRLAKVQLSYATIKAPNGGVVVAVSSNVGENASPGTTLMTLADPNDLWVRAYVPEPQIGDVSVGAPATVRNGDDKYAGTISFVATEAEFTPNTVETEENRTNLVYEVRVRISEGGDQLKPGLPVDVELER